MLKEKIDRRKLDADVARSESNNENYFCRDHGVNSDLDSSEADDFPKLRIVEGSENVTERPPTTHKDGSAILKSIDNTAVFAADSLPSDGALKMKQACSSPNIGGCRKRKLYQPIQHEAAKSAEEERIESEQSIFRSQLQLMEDHLNLMKKKYCSLLTFKKRIQSDAGNDVLQAESRSGDRNEACAADIPADRFSLAQNGIRAELSDASATAAASPRYSNKLTSIHSHRQPFSPSTADWEVCDLINQLKAEMTSSLVEAVDAAVNKYARNVEKIISRSCRTAMQCRDFANEDTRQQMNNHGRVLNFDVNRGKLLRRKLYEDEEAGSRFVSDEFNKLLDKSSLNPFQGSASLDSSPVSVYDSGSDTTNVDEAISLVMTPKKRRTKITDMKLTSKTPSKMSRSCSADRGILSERLFSSRLLNSQISLLNSHSNALIPFYPDSKIDESVERSSIPCSPRDLDCYPLSQHVAGNSHHPKDIRRTRIQNEEESLLSLRKAKLMFFWMRYPSSTVLRTYFPDVRFDKNNTAQLIKWFSNFREFFYIHIEKQARQILDEGASDSNGVYVSADSDLYRVLNAHYNRNNRIEPPDSFRNVVEQTLKEFLSTISNKRDREPSWKKSIYKIIARMDEQAPEYFHSVTCLDEVE